jgi:cytochrome c
MSKWVVILAASCFAVAVVAVEAAEPLSIGRAASVHDISQMDLTVFPDGTGLPDGKGTAKAGTEIFAARCAACHGDKGQGLGDFPALVGGRGSLASDKPLLTVGSYWPYATTIFDYIRRAMPYQSAGELTSDEVYSLTAWILAQNGIIKPSAVIDRNVLPKVKMPNRDGFIADPRPDVKAGVH